MTAAISMGLKRDRELGPRVVRWKEVRSRAAFGSSAIRWRTIRRALRQRVRASA